MKYEVGYVGVTQFNKTVGWNNKLASEESMSCLAEYSVHYNLKPTN